MSAALLLRLALAWGRIKAGLAAAAAWAAKNPLLALCAVLTGACLLEWHEWSIKAKQVAHLSAEIVQFRDAQARAAELAQEALHHQEAVYLQKAKDADDAYQSKLADADARTRAYIASHRLDGLRADSAGAAGQPPASTPGGSSQGGNGSGAAPELVAVTAADIEICTVNTQRLQAVHDWALGLNQ